MESPAGFEPASSGWKPEALPLDDGDVLRVLVVEEGFEPPTLCLWDRRSGQAELLDSGVVAETAGFEPARPGVRARPISSRGASPMAALPD